MRPNFASQVGPCTEKAFQGSHRSMSAQQYIPSYVQQTIFTPGVVGQERSIRRTPGHSNGLPSHAYRNNSPKVESGPKSDYGSSHHNAVDIERIRQGTDVRTTVRAICCIEWSDFVPDHLDHAPKHSQQD